MSIFNDDYPVEVTLSIKDLLPGGKFKGGQGLTYQQALDADAEAGSVVYPNVGEWIKISQFNRIIIIDDGSVFSIKNKTPKVATLHALDYDKFGGDDFDETLRCYLLTNPIILSSLANIKEIKALRLAYEGNDLELQPEVNLYCRNNFHDEKYKILCSPFVDPNGHLIYYLREAAKFKIFELEISWVNTKASYIKKLLGVSLIYDNSGETR